MKRTGRQSKNIEDSRNKKTFAKGVFADSVSKEYQGTNLTDAANKKSLKMRGVEYQKFKSASKHMADDHWIPVDAYSQNTPFNVKKTQVTPGEWNTKIRKGPKRG